MGHSGAGPSQAHLCFALGLPGETSTFHNGCVFYPSVASLAAFFLFKRCTASSHHAADRNGWVSFLTSWFIFTTVHEMDTCKLVSSWHTSCRVVFSVEDISVIVAVFSRGVSHCTPLCCCFYYPFLLAKGRRTSAALCDCPFPFEALHSVWAGHKMHFCVLLSQALRLLWHSISCYIFLQLN